MVILKRRKLSYDDNYWGYDYARVYDNVKIYLYSKICGQVYGNPEVYVKLRFLDIPKFVD